jgi:hypothetical protein
MPTTKNITYVEQSAASKPLTLHPGDISPEVMREFEDSCKGYFNMKEIEPDHQVRKITVIGSPAIMITSNSYCSETS